MISGGFGAPEAWASAFTMRSMASTVWRLSLSSKLRTLIRSNASSGIFILGPGLHRPNGDHDRLGCRDLARHDGLQPHDRRCGHDDRIDTRFRHGPMCAAPEQPDLQAVGSRLSRPGPVADLASFAGHDVLTKNDLRLGEPLEQAVIDHRPGTLSNLLRWLEYREQCPVPGMGCCCEQAGGPDQPGDVRVVPAGMHDGNLVPFAVGTEFNG